MEYDACYITPEGEEYKLVKQNVYAGSCKVAIIAATDNLYSNKKNLWTALDVLDKDGYAAIQCPLHELDRVLPFLRTNDFDVVLFENDKIGGRSGCCFYDSTVSFVFVYKLHRPMCWCLGNRPNVFHCQTDPGIEKRHGSKITAKLLEPTNVQDTVLVLGGRAFYHIENIKNLCRYTIAFGTDIFSNVQYQGIKVYEGAK